jgi:Ca2+-binding EF-hand superfamily protein
MHDTYRQMFGDEFVVRIKRFNHSMRLQQILVNNLISELRTDDEYKVLMRAFQEIDFDNNGFVDRKEIYQYLLKMRLSKQDAKIRSKQIMLALDHKQTGEINRKQFIDNMHVNRNMDSNRNRNRKRKSKQLKSNDK